MLKPQRNQHRQYIELSGFWDFCPDPLDRGVADNWGAGFSDAMPIAVPASWNDQFEDYRDFLGPAWYQTRFDLPWGWENQKVFLRFGSVNYLAEVWLNGVRLGQHEGGHLPFEYELTSGLLSRDNVLVVRVDGNLAFDHVPPGNLPTEALGSLRSNSDKYPDTMFDFFPFCGIHRPVLLYAVPQDAIEDLTVVTNLEGGTGIVHVSLRRTAGDSVTCQVELTGHGSQKSVSIDLDQEMGEVVIRLPNAALWSPSAPNLYDLNVELSREEVSIDSYSLPIGIRTIAVDGDRLLLNGEPIMLKGFGRHEDFPVVGRGLMPALIIKDYALMRWIGANSFRTSHYPYSEEMMDLADRLGFLVIDETPAVGLYFHPAGLQRRQELCLQYIKDLIARDKNHPSVIMWSLANEPHSQVSAAKPYFEEQYALTRQLDDSRLVTHVSCLGPDDESLEFGDVVCLNRYRGWYYEVGRLDEGCEVLSSHLDAIHDRYPKPLVLAEFGADTLSGWHAQPPEMFSEEYQAEMLISYIQVLASKPYVVGQHVWNMCDFKTGQSIRRVGGLNLKGVFTRDRRPKLAAHRLREIWLDPKGD